MGRILGFLGLPSPAVLLGIIVAVLLSGIIGAGAGAFAGYRWSELTHVADVAAAQVKAIDDANTAVALATERAMAQARKEANARLAAREVRHKGELDAITKSRPECRRDAESVGLLNNAIDSANGEGPTGSGVPAEVRPTSEAAGWLGTLRSSMGISDRGAVRPVSPPAQ